MNAPLVDPALTTTHYERNKEQNHLVGIFEEELKEIKEEEETEGLLKTKKFFMKNKVIGMYFLFTADDNDASPDTLADEVLHFGTNCPSCNAPCETNMKLTSKTELDQDCNQSVFIPISFYLQAYHISRKSLSWQPTATLVVTEPMR